MDLDQQLSEFKKIVDQLDDDRFDDVATSMLFDAGTQEPLASHISAAEVRRANDSKRDLEFALGCPDIFWETEAVNILSQNLVRARISSNETRAQVSIAAVQPDRQVLAKHNKQVELHRIEAENDLRRQREEISRLKQATEQAETRLAQKQKSLDDLANCLEQQRLAQLAVAEKLLRQQQESSEQLETSVRESEDRLERKRTTLLKLASVVKVRRRAQKELSDKQLASNRSRKRKLKHEVKKLLLEKKGHRAEIEKQNADLDQQRTVMLAERNYLQQRRQEIDEQQASFELQQLKLDQLREEIEQKMIELESQQREHERQRNLFEEQRKHVKRVECSEQPSAKVELEANFEDVRENPNCGNELIASTDQEAFVADQQKFEEMQFIIRSNLRRLRFEETRRYRGYKWLLGHFDRSKTVPMDCNDGF